MGPHVESVARILELIRRPPNLRREPRPGDLEGDFDQWFDGGAIKGVTGSTYYHFADGSRATVPVTVQPRVTIVFPDGWSVSVTWAR